MRWDKRDKKGIFVIFSLSKTWWTKKSYSAVSLYNSCERISWSANTALQRDSHFCFSSSNFIFVPESHIRHNLTHLIPASCVHAFCRANTSSTCLLSQSVWLSCPLCRDVLCASLSIHLSFSAVRLVNITVSFFFPSVGSPGLTAAHSNPPSCQSLWGDDRMKHDTQ